MNSISTVLLFQIDIAQNMDSRWRLRVERLGMFSDSVHPDRRYLTTFANRDQADIPAGGSVRLAEQKEPLINAAFGPQISADRRNNVSVNQRFLLLVKVA